MRYRALLLIILIFLPWNVVGASEYYEVSDGYTNEEGKVVPFNAHNGTYLVLDAFATWCQPCEVEMAHLKEVQDVIKDEEEVELLSISMDPKTDTLPKVRDFMERFDAKWQYGLDHSGNLSEYFEIRGYPTTFIINPNGEILKTWLGVTESDLILEELDKYVDLPGDLVRSLDLDDLVENLFNSIFLYVFFVLLWIMIIYSGYKVINGMKRVE